MVSSVLILLAVIAAIAALMRSGDELLRQPLHLNPILVVLSFVMACSGLLVAIPVWRRILKYYGICQPMRDDIRMYCYGALGVALPGSIWLILGRSALYGRQGVSVLRVATASVVESFVIGVAAVIVYAVTSVIRPNLSPWQHPELALGVALLALFVLHPRILNLLIRQAWRLTKRIGEPLSVNFRPAEIAVWIGLEAIVIVMGGISLFILLASFASVPATISIQIVSVWAVGAVAGNLLFWLPGTYIVRDGALVVVLTSIMTLPVAILFTLLARLWSIFSLLVLAAFIWLVFDMPHVLHKYKPSE